MSSVWKRSQPDLGASPDCPGSEQTLYPTSPHELGKKVNKNYYFRCLYSYYLINDLFFLFFLALAIENVKNY